MEYRDYYEVLGVPKDADENAIKAAYRKLARKHHPDVNPNKAEAERRFKEINEAYEVLSDKDKRGKYDRFGADWQRAQQSGQTGGFDWSQYQAQPGQGGYTRYSTEDLRDLFGESAPFSDFFTFMFGGEGAQVQPRTAKGRDIEQTIAITLAEAFKGTTRRLKRAGGPTIEVKIPPGAETGTRLRVKGQGMPSRRGQPGDLWLVVAVEDDPRFVRQGADLHTRTQVHLYAAVLGGEAAISLMEGKARLRIPAETQPGSELRLKGQGMPVYGDTGKRGDLYVAIDIRLPTRLSEKERALFQELAGLRPEEK
ncbi:J domain-containing protein [candidate division WOR-3 bacterium]|nr:J domain-containing protein [candidate division WOR-3 bacterium]